MGNADLTELLTCSKSATLLFVYVTRSKQIIAHSRNVQWKNLYLENVVVKWLTLPLHICKSLSMNIGSKTSYSDWGSRCFPQYLQPNAAVVP